MKQCHNCHHPWESETKTPGVKEYCEKCNAYLHCCKNCTHYAPGAHNDCYIGTTEWVSDKTGANFCDEFVFSLGRSNVAGATKAQSAKDAFHALFNDNDSDSTNSGDKLNKLRDM